MKKYRFLWVLVGILLFSFPIAAKAGDEEMLMGRWKGGWYSYARKTTAKVELEITSISPIKGKITIIRTLLPEYDKLVPEYEVEAVEGDVKNGKVLIKFQALDSRVVSNPLYTWDFELSLKGKTLEGDGKNRSRNIWAYTNLHLEKVD